MVNQTLEPFNIIYSNYEIKLNGFIEAYHIICHINALPN